MKLSETIIEFIMPGVVFLFPFLIMSIIFVHDNPTLSFFTTLENGQILIGIIYGCLSYIAGVLLSEGGTKILEKSSNKRVGEVFFKYKELLTNVKYNSNRNVDLEKALSTDLWHEFSYVRAYCRTHSDKASDRIKSHESILRVLRPSTISIPSCIFFIGVVILWKSNTYWDKLSISSYLLVVLSVLVFFLLKRAYLQRLGTTVKSALQHFLAIQNISTNGIK